eukprot:tig00000246_g21503.t1
MSDGRNPLSDTFFAGYGELSKIPKNLLVLYGGRCRERKERLPKDLTASAVHALLCGRLDGDTNATRLAPDERPLEGTIMSIPTYGLDGALFTFTAPAVAEGGAEPVVLTIDEEGRCVWSRGPQRRILEDLETTVARGDGALVFHRRAELPAASDPAAVERGKTIALGVRSAIARLVALLLGRFS